MPNWCSTNYAIRGKEEELKEFASIINSLPHKESVAENGFGPYWIGNLVSALGADWKAYPCKGAVDPNPDCPAYFLGPCPDEDNNEVEVIDGFLRFSIMTAWDHKQVIDDLIKSKFPSFEFFWRSTDDCGNFHIVNDPEDKAAFGWFYLNDGQESTWYEKTEKDKFFKDLKNMCPELTIDPNITECEKSYNSFIKTFCDWRDKDENRSWMEMVIFFQI